MQALTGEPITIYGEGEQTRSFCYCLDLIEAFVRIMDTDDSFTGPVNIGNPDEFTIRQLAEKVIAMTNSRSELVFRELPSDDPTQRRPDISMAKRELGWEPQVKLEQGLQKTIEYFASLLDAGDSKVHAFARAR
jgi:UDP-glucuronate decarboxylase